MGKLKFIEKGDKVIKKKQFDEMKAEYEKLKEELAAAMQTLYNANTMSREAPFREGLYLLAEEALNRADQKCFKVGLYLKGA